MVKDEEEIENIKKASGFACFLQNKMIEQVEKIIDEGLRQKHDKISQIIEQSWQKEDSKKHLERKLNLDADMLDISFSPVIQSGGIYDIRP